MVWEIGGMTPARNGLRCFASCNTHAEHIEGLDLSYAWAFWNEQEERMYIHEPDVEMGTRYISTIGQEQGVLPDWQDG
jgi:hypothetical protein